MHLPGFMSFRFVRGRWRRQRGSEEIADGAPIHCGACGERHMMDDLDDPSTLRIEKESFFELTRGGKA